MKALRSKSELFGGNDNGGILDEKERLNRESVILNEEIDELNSLKFSKFPHINNAIRKEIQDRVKRINEIEEELGLINKADLI